MRVTQSVSKNVYPTTKPYKRGCVYRRKRRSLTRSEPCQTVNGNERGRGGSHKTEAPKLRSKPCFQPLARVSPL